MAVVTVRPNAVVSGSGNFTITGGVSAAGVTSDDSDASYVSNATSGVATLILDCGTTALSASETVRRVRVRARVITPTTAGKVNVNIGTRQSGTNKYSAALSIRGQYAAATTLTGAWLTTSPFGGAWSQADIDAIRIQVTEYKSGADEANIIELFVDVDKATKPTVTVSTPTGTVTDTAKPEVSFAYTDPDASDEQAFFEVKMFSAAQYGAAGFEPTEATATFDSGTIASVEQTYTITDYLDNATYRAYVRVAKNIGGVAFWSDWAYSGFTLNVTRPTAPTVSVSWSQANSRASVTITGTASASFDYQYFEVERSIDGGTVYEQVRNGNELYPGVGFAATLYDYEVKRGLTARYRARSIGVVGNNVANSAWSTVQTVSVTSDSKYWLKAVADPTLNYGDATVLNRLGVTIEENLGVFRPIGRNLPIVVSGTIGGSDGELEIVTTTSGAWTAVYALATYQYTILLQEPTNEQKYVRFVGRSWEEQQVGAVSQRILRITYIEVDPDE